MSDEVLQKLQDKATLLTAERKKVRDIVCKSFLKRMLYWHSVLLTNPDTVLALFC